MSQISYGSEHIEAVRQETLAFLDQLQERANAFDLPPSDTLTQCRLQLRTNSYKVLVVGEAKRGKSTFINALIGRDILPTDIDVATSQVFHVRRAEREAYRLRFEDNSTQELTLSDLPRYGSQGAGPTQDVWLPHQVIRWIEAEVPIRFLPDGVSLLDTPGLGSLYAAHAQITYRFAPQADAVIFVLDSERPLMQAELEFIDTLLGVTQDIFFVQTKIDLFGQGHWQAVLQRNEELLAERFQQLTTPRIWPISSTILRSAAKLTQHAEALWLASHHEELIEALQAFLFRAAGWQRLAETLLVTQQYHAGNRQTLSTRFAELAAEISDRKPQGGERQEGERRGRQFDAEWGKDGAGRQALYNRVRRINALGKQRFAQALSVYPPGKIHAAFDAKIATIRSPQEAERFAVELPGEVAAMAMSCICVDFEKQIVFRVKRLIRVRNVKCFRSIFCV